MAITRLGGANAITGTIPQGNIANASLGAVTALPAAITTGKVLQIVSDTTTDTTTVGSTTFTDVTNLSVSITPAATSSKILLIASMSGRNYAESNALREYKLAFVRGSTIVYQKYAYDLEAGVGANNRYVSPIQDISFVDSPSSTSALTYKVQMAVSDISDNTFIQARTTSSLIAMEVAG